MTFEEFETASSAGLRQEAKQCFDRSVKQSPGPLEIKAPLLLEAQFYMAELARRENNADSEKSHRMERIIIWLIVFELLLAIVGIGMDIRGGQEEIKALGQIERAISSLPKR